MVRRNFLKESRHLLNVAISRNKGAKRALNDAVEGAGHEAIGLTEHLNTVATLVGEWFNPDAVLLVSTCGPGVLAAQLIGPRDALLTRTESEGALTTVTADNVGQGVGLRAEDRRVGAILITELRVDGDAVQLDVAVAVSGTRVTTRGSHVHVARDQTFAHAVSVGQVGGLGDTTTSDHVGVDDLGRRIRLGGRRFRRQGSWRGLSRLRGHGPVEAARSEARGHAGHQSQSQSS